MKVIRNQQLRQRLTHEAARLMYEEGVKEFFRAKKIATKRLLGRGGQQRIRFRPKDLPSNGEIQEALLQLAHLHEGEFRTKRLFAMRVIALETMNSLLDFKPALIGSVSTGHVRKGSDIDIHVFCDESSLLESHLDALGWDFEKDEVTIRKADGFQEYTHFYIEHIFPIEITVYDQGERRVRQRSSTDGKPIVRLKPKHLEALICEKHLEQWLDYQQTQDQSNFEQYADDFLML